MISLGQLNALKELTAKYQIAIRSHSNEVRLSIVEIAEILNDVNRLLLCVAETHMSTVEKGTTIKEPEMDTSMDGGKF